MVKKVTDTPFYARAKQVRYSTPGRGVRHFPNGRGLGNKCFVNDAGSEWFKKLQ